MANTLEFKSSSQYKEEFLKYLAIGLTTLLFLALLIMIIPPTATISNFIFIIITIGINIAILYLNSHGFSKLAAHIFCHNFNILIFISIYLNIISADLTQLILSSCLLSLTVFLSSMLISRNAVIGFASLNIFFILILPLPFNNPIAPHVIFPIIFFLILSTIISWLYQRTLENSQIHLSLAHQQLLQTELITRDLQIAQDFQNQLYPPTLQIGEQLSIASRSMPGHEISGNFYDFIQGDPNELGIVIADVAGGKGLAAALTIAMTRSVIRTEIQHSDNPGLILHKTNQVLFRDYALNKMITAFCGILNTETFIFQFSNAGHIFPILKRGDTLTDLVLAGLPLRSVPDAQYNNKTIQLQTGDQLFFITEGVINVKNMAQNIFGFKRLKQIIRQFDNTHSTNSKEPLATVWQAIENFQAERFDDQTIIVISIHKNMDISNKANYQRLVGQAIINQEFRHKLIANPKETIQESGLELGADEIKHLVASIEKFKHNISDAEAIAMFERLNVRWYGR